MKMYKLKKNFKISCSHRLFNPKFSEEKNKELFGKCSNAPSHGHNYDIIVYLKEDILYEETGMLMNFDKIKKIFKKYIDDIYDHKYLNECPGFENKIPTAENMAKIFFDILKPTMLPLYAIEVEETDGASAIYEVDK